jgi:hypothetical protein
MDDVEFDFAPLMQPPAAGAPRPTPTQPRAPAGDIEFDFSGIGAKPTQAARSPQQQARDDAQAKAAYESMTRSTLPPRVQQAVSAAGAYGRSFAPGIFEYLPALGAKALGKLGVSGYEQAAEAPISDLRSRARAIETEAAEKYPKTAGAGTVAGLGAGIATLPTVTKLPYFGALGTMGSGAATGALYGGISEGAEKGTLEGAGLGAGLGLLAGGTLSPLAEKAISGTAALAGYGRPVVDKFGQLTEEAINMARSAGLSDAKIAELTPELTQTFTQRGLTTAAAREAPFARFGIEPKRGMVSEDPMQLKREFQYGDYSPIVQQAAKGVEAELGGPQISLRDAIGAAVSRGEQEASKLKSSYERAYQTAGETPGSFSRDSLTNVGDKLLNQFARDETALAFRGSGHVQDAAKKLNENLGQFLETGDPAAPRVMWRNFRAVEEARKGLNQYLTSARDKTDRAGMRRMIDDFDQHIEDSINSGAFSGDKSIADQWRNARKLFSQYQDKFGYRKSGEESGQLMRQIINGEKSPEEVGNMMFNFASTGEAKAKSTALKTYLQLKRALGSNAPELSQIESSFLQQLMTPTIRENEKATPKAFAKTAEQIDSFLKGPQAAFAAKITSPKDREVLQMYADVMRQASIEPKNLTPEKMSRLTQFMYTASPIAANVALTSLGYIHPILASVISIPAAFAGRYAAIKGGEYAAQKASQRGPETVSRMYDLPAVRRAVPLMYEGAQQESDGGRIGRATGGGVRLGMTSQMLIAAVERAKAEGQKSTESILEQPDEHVVRALKVANENI